MGATALREGERGQGSAGEGECAVRRRLVERARPPSLRSQRAQLRGAPAWSVYSEGGAGRSRVMMVDLAAVVTKVGPSDHDGARLEQHLRFKRSAASSRVLQPTAGSVGLLTQRWRRSSTTTSCATPLTFVLTLALGAAIFRPQVRLRAVTCTDAAPCFGARPPATPPGRTVLFGPPGDVTSHGREERFPGSGQPVSALKVQAGSGQPKLALS